jgi:hypothetical protein
MERITTTFVVWGWARSLIYIGGLLAFVAGSARLITYPTPEYTTLEKLPSVLAPAAWGFAGWMLYRARKVWLEKWIWATQQGVSVWGEQATRDWLATREIRVELTIADVMQWWASYFIRTGHIYATKTISEWFNGSNLEVAMTESGVGDFKHGIRKKAGLAYPKRIVLALRPSDMGTGAVFLATLGHEASHECLFAMGVPDAEHHDLMKKAGCPYA